MRMKRGTALEEEDETEEELIQKIPPTLKTVTTRKPVNVRCFRPAALDDVEPQQLTHARRRLQPLRSFEERAARCTVRSYGA